jgi:hypothetical protein
MFARRSSDAATTEADIEIPDSWGYPPSEYRTS